MRRPQLALAALFLLVIGLYGWVLGGPVFHDDLVYIETSPMLRLPWGEFLSALFGRRYFVASLESTYQPLVTFLHYLTWTYPPLYRFLGLVLHSLNAFLIYLLVRRLIRQGEAGLVAAALFVVFPPSTETINIASFQGHLLAGTATLACLLCWIKVLEGGWRAPWAMGACLACFALGCLAKETILLVPALMAAYWRLYAGQAPRRIAGWTFSGVAALALGYLCWRFTFLEPMSVAGRLWFDPLAFLGWYLRLMICPYPLCLERSLTGLWFCRALGTFFLIGGWLLRRETAAFFGWIWVVVELVPYLRLVPFASVNPMADRYAYMAVAGFCIILTRILNGPRGRWIAGAVALGWGMLSIERNVLYRNPGVLYEQTVSCAPDSGRAHCLLGTLQMQEGRYPQAKSSLERSLALDANSPVSWGNLGIVEYMRGDFKASVVAFQKALLLDDSAPLHDNLDLALKAARLEHRKP